MRSPSSNTDMTVVNVNDNVVDTSIVITGVNLSLSAMLGVTTMPSLDTGQPCLTLTTLWDVLSLAQPGYSIDPTTTGDPMTIMNYGGEGLGLGNIFDLAECKHTSKKRKIDLSKLISEAIKLATDEPTSD
jgi:hypothetical protein